MHGTIIGAVIGFVSRFIAVLLLRLGLMVGEGMDEDIQHLANAIYHEARGESQEGKIAVGQVILNRVADPRFPGSIYEVIYQPKQFSGIRQYKVPQSYVDMAKGILAGNYANLIGKSLFFNNFRQKGCKFLIGHHCFF